MGLDKKLKNVMIIQHEAVETLGTSFTEILKHKGFNFYVEEIFKDKPNYSEFNPLPLSEIQLLIILGGAFSANDKYEALQKEEAYIHEALTMRIPTFGICLGAQLMAKALGGEVTASGGYQFGLRKIFITQLGDIDTVFGEINTPLVPTLHGDCFTIPKKATKLAEGYILLNNHRYKKINMAFKFNNSYAFQFEPQLTLEEFYIWNKVLKEDYKLMGDNFDPNEEASRNDREFSKFSSIHEKQMGRMFLSFLKNAGLVN
jgi:GMP synthase (glutamine-hydrolysing)